MTTKSTKKITWYVYLGRPRGVFESKKAALSYAYRIARKINLGSEYVYISRSDVPIYHVGMVIKVKDKRFYYTLNGAKQKITGEYELKADGTLVR